MAMPEQNMSWPPTHWQPAYIAYEENAAWWEGDQAKLTSLYGGNSSVHLDTHVAASRAKRKTYDWLKFWGGKQQTPQTPIRRHHLPIAANLATLSSDLQFAQSPLFMLDGRAPDDDSAQGKLLNEIMNSERSLSQLGTYGETKAALGAAVMVPMWDQELAHGEVWWEAFGPDTAIPVFRNGVLAEVTLWSEAIEGQTHWRLLANHAVEGGAGYIEYGLYEGSRSKLGTRVDLMAHDLGKPYAGIVDAESRVLTGLDRLDAVYGINTPTIEWRRDPFLRYAGRSDFAQLHGLFDDADRIWSSLIRDIRLGAGRTFVPEAYLASNGRGQGASFDDTREYLTGLTMPGSAEDGKPQIHHQQFKIRVEEHEHALNITYREVLRKAGYSPSSWGDGAGQQGGGQITATEIEDRNAASERTRAKKNMHDRMALSQLARNMLDIHAHLYGSERLGDLRPVVDFPEMSQESPRELAETVSMLDAAAAISLDQKVARANPGWTPSQVTNEANAIRAERGLQLPDPATLSRVGELIAATPLEGEEGDDDAGN